MTPDTKASIYLASAFVGAFAAIGMAAAQIFDWSGFVHGLCIAALLGSLAMILRRKLRDEYTQGLWQAGTSAAFVAVVVLAIFGPVVVGFAHGLIDGFNDAPRDTSRVEVGVDFVGIGAILAFYGGFLVAWFRSAR